MKQRNPDRSAEMRQEEGLGDSEGERTGLEKASLAEKLCPPTLICLSFFWRPSPVPRLLSKCPRAVPSSALRLRQWATQ